jgi:hypothetical protein
MPRPIPGWQGKYLQANGQEDLTHAGSPPSWNQLTINGTKLPWLARLVSIRHKLVKVTGRASGKGPGSPTVRGREPGVFTFQFKLRNNKEWDDFVELAPKLLPVVQKSASDAQRLTSSVQVYYPMVAAFGIRWAIVDEIEGTAPDGGGPALVKVVFEETQDPTTIKTQQAKPKPSGLEAAPTIDIAGSAPRVPSLRDTTRKPVTAAR